MKTAIFFTNKFVKAHKLRALLSVVVISLFISAFQAALIYNDCYEKTVELNVDKTYGRESGIIYNADKTQALSFAEAVQDEYSLICGYNKIAAEEISNTYYTGYMSEDALSSKLKGMVSGRLPQSADEAAVELSAYYALGLSAEIGETFAVAVTEDGQTVEKSYVLCGITESYLLDWQKTDSSKKSFLYPPPVIITANKNYSEAEFLNIMCSDRPDDFLGGEYAEKSVTHDHSIVAGVKASVYYFTLPAAAVFALVMVFGISGVLSYTMKDRDRYMRLLQNIGMTKGSCRLIYIVMAIELAAASCIVGSFFSVGVSFAASQLLTFLSSGQSLVYIYNIGYALLGCALNAAVIIISFFLSASKHYSGKKSSYTAGLKKRAVCAYKSIYSMMRKARSGINRSQNAITCIIVFLCVFISGFGWFISQLYVMKSSASIASGNYAEYFGDFQLYISGGSSLPENYYANIPEGSGVSMDMYEYLTETEGIQLKFASVSETFGSFIRYNPSEKIDFYDSVLEENREIKKEDIPTYSTALETIEGEESDFLIEMRTVGLPFECISTVTDGYEGVDRSAFDSGAEIIAPAGIYEIGDKVTLLTVDIENPDKETHDPERFCFRKTEAKVTALTEYSEFFISAKYITDIHTTAKFSDIQLYVTDISDESLIEGISAKVNTVASTSQYVTIRNGIEEREEYLAKINSGKRNTAFILLIFVFITSAAIVVSVRLKTKTNIRSFLLLRALGADSKTVLRMIVSDSLRPCVIGSATAFSASLVLSAAFAGQYTYISTAALITQSHLLCAVTACAIVILCVFMARREACATLKLSVSEGLEIQKR